MYVARDLISNYCGVYSSSRETAGTKRCDEEEEEEEEHEFLGVYDVFLK